MIEQDPTTEIDELAVSVAEGEVVDWEAAEQTAQTASESEGRRIRALRILAQIGELNESLQAGEEPGNPSEHTATPAVSAEAPIAQQAIGAWGPLELLERAGSGASADVYRARDTQLDREVALKLLRARGGSATKALQEGRLLARVRHPNVATVYGADQRDGQVGVWMEFVRGKTLHRLVEDQGPMGAKEAALVGVELCRALAAVHAEGVVHRDIKAQNAMRAEGGRILLVDFGIGLDLAAESASTATVSGTPVYLAPEVFAGAPATFLSDLYSLGVLLFFLVTGKLPVSAESISALRERHRKGERKLLRDVRPDLPAELVRVVEKAISPRPEDRYPTAGALEQALAEVLGGVASGEGARRAGKLRAGRGRWKRRVGWTVAAVTLIGLGLGVVYREDLIREHFLRKANRLHEEGERELEIGALRDGLAMLKDDPLLLSRLSDAFVGAGRYTEGLEYSKRAFQLRNRLGRVDQHRVAVSYYLNHLDYAQARDADKEAARLDPSDDNAMRDAAGFEMMLRNFPQALELARKAIETNPEDVINHGTLAVLQAQSGDVAGALAAVRKGREETGDLPYFYWGEGLALAVEGSYDGARIAFRNLMQGEHAYSSNGTLLETQISLLEGNLAGAKTSLETALEKDLAQGQEGARATRLAWLADLALLRGQVDEARDRLRWLQQMEDVPIHLKFLRAAALSYAKLGDLEASLKVLERIRAVHSSYPTSISGGVVAQVEGEMARVVGDRRRAVERLTAAREQWGDADTLLSLVRAKREARLCREALEDIAELRKMKGFILQEHIATIWKLSQLEQARCHRDLGEVVPARDAYQAFLDLWRTNAADLPVVREAEKELAALLPR